MSKQSEFIDVKTAAKKMNVSKRTVRELCKQKYLKANKVGSKPQSAWQIKTISVDAWLKNPTSPKKPFYERHLYLSLAAILSIFASFFGIIADSDTRETIYNFFVSPPPTSFALTPTPIPADTLVVLIPYSGHFSEIEFYPERMIRDALQVRISDLNKKDYNIRLEVWSQPVITAREAREIGKSHGATLVIWGEFDDVIGIRTFVEILPELPSFDIQQGGSFLTLPMYKLKNPANAIYEPESTDILYECLRNDVASLADYTVLLSLGILELVQSFPQRAGELFTEALQISGTSQICQWHTDQAYYWRGITWMMQERYRDAQNDFSQASMENPNFWPALAQLGSVNLALGYPAESSLQAASKLIPQDDVANYVIVQSNLCLARIPDGTPEATETCYQSVEEKIDNEFIPPAAQLIYLVHLGNWYLSQKDCNQAESYYLDALALLDERDSLKEVALIEEHRGLVAVCQGKFDQANRNYTDARTIYEENDLPVSMARIQVRLGMLDYLQGLPTAKSKLEKAMTLAQEASSPYYESWAYIGLGLAKEQDGNITEACQHYQKALQLLERLGSPEAQIVRNVMKQLKCDEN